MADNERPSQSTLAAAIRAQRDMSSKIEQTDLSETLVKSMLWKEKTLFGIESDRSGDNDEAANPKDGEQSNAPRARGEAIERLQQSMLKLKAENARLAAQHQEDLGAHQAELLEFQAAYDQFQQQSDRLINELDQENERLRSECKLANKRSVL